MDHCAVSSRPEESDSDPEDLPCDRDSVEQLPEVRSRNLKRNAPNEHQKRRRAEKRKERKRSKKEMANDDALDRWLAKRKKKVEWDCEILDTVY